MIGAMDCSALEGFNGRKVKVEVDIARGLPSFTIVGLAENSVKESRVRVQSAICNAGFDFPKSKISVNLAPADVQKSGTAFDLSIALSILMAAGLIPKAKLKDIAAIGELALSGEIRPVRGMLALAESVFMQGKKILLVAEANAKEASLIKGLQIKIVKSFGELVGALLQDKVDDFADAPAISFLSDENSNLDMTDVVGQVEAKRAMLIAAAGNHNLLFIGGPGSGKSMMASRLSGILPPLDYQEALILTKIYSLAGLTLGGNLMQKRPFRAPHHSITKAGLAGGGSGFIRPGEISLASFGVLFLDELLEFPRGVLEVLRQPLENGEITLNRANHCINYPAAISLVAALNPCPCGYFGQANQKCQCSPLAINRYQSRLSGPLIDRIDLHVNVMPLDLRLMNAEQAQDSSASMRAKVIMARKKQSERLGEANTNGKMSRNQIKTLSQITSKAYEFLINSADLLSLSARGFDRILRVARTIADLADDTKVHEHHIKEALYFRPSAVLGK